ncbi:golgin subfamily A member 6-like protein 6 [Alligator sinensis]|uniref:Golgin subfamily A member 6-like protein 6 n=1 Tax=Alligator sinensis TaxID=38654 RepID=A0A3Q0GVH1_ALLSI|nr:golgin subfamily A member 6-like protein 6 [Alligator sinensis]
MDPVEDTPPILRVPCTITETQANKDQESQLETGAQKEVTNGLSQPQIIHKEGKINSQEEQELAKFRQVERNNTELEKMRINFELTMLKYQQLENEKQRQHEEKMEQMRQQAPLKPAGSQAVEHPGNKLDPITEIELEKMRMEFELSKLRYIYEENERQRQHEQKMLKEKEKQWQHEENMEETRWRKLPRRGSQKNPSGKTEATAEMELGNMKIELELAMLIYLKDMNEKQLQCEKRKKKEKKSLEQAEEEKQEDTKEEKQEEIMKEQVPCTVVTSEEPEWLNNRFDLAVESELERRRMEFELTRLEYEHKENEKQRQHEEKMEQMRQQAALSEVR